MAVNVVGIRGSYTILSLEGQLQSFAFCIVLKKVIEHHNGTAGTSFVEQSLVR